MATGLLVISLLATFAVEKYGSSLANRTRNLYFQLTSQKVETMDSIHGPLLLVALPPVRGPLRVSSENPRYFMDTQGKEILLTGSHTWLNLVDGYQPDPPAPFDYPKFLDFLVQHNHNFFRLWTWEQAKWVNESSEIYYFSPQPYLRTGPGNALDGKPKFDLTKFNQAYFDRMRERVIAARDRGIYVSVMLFNGWSLEYKWAYTLAQPWNGHPFNESNNINNVDGDTNNNGGGEEIETLSNQSVILLQEAYVMKVIDTVNDLDNVLYEISNEGPSNSEAWQGHFIQFIKDYEATKPYQHPVGMTVEWPNGSNDDLFNSQADWISPNGDINNPPVADGSKVIIADTDHLCGICGDRAWVWKSFTHGENPIFMDQYNDGYKLEGGGYNMNNPNDVSLRRNMGYALAYANRMNLGKMAPHSNLCSTGYCLANPTASAAEYLVYAPNGGNISVNLSATSELITIEWLDPSTGMTYAGGVATGGGNRSFSAPFSGDAVLYLHTSSTPAHTDIIYLPFVSKTLRSTTLNPLPAGAFLETFDGVPSSPQPWNSINWDIQVHSRDIDTWFALEPMDAGHSMQCGAPPTTHAMNGDYADAIFQCRDHVMTAINASGYGAIYLTPNRMIDFSSEEAVLRFDMSTLRKSHRDWVDLWITPFSENVALPLDSDVDLAGVPKDAVHIRMDAGDTGFFFGSVYSNFQETRLPTASRDTYESVLTPSEKDRTTFELRISPTHIRFGLPGYDLWWIDTDIARLSWDTGVIQFGHHSYTPKKDCQYSSLVCLPNTWHWDNVGIYPWAPFTMIKADKRLVRNGNANQTITFAAPAPANAYLRFTGIGTIAVSLGGGSFRPAIKAQSSLLPGIGDYHPEHLSSYWMSIPQGTRTVRFRFSADDWYNTNFEMIAKDFSIWSLGGN